MTDWWRSAVIKAGLTQEALAERMGTTQSAIARLEGGRVSPSVGTLRRYAAGVGKTLRVGFVFRDGGGAQ